jgi:tellurite methyltransferase
VARRSVDFFDAQFRRQIEFADFRLNPFEARALPFLAGRVLDLGCGLGNLAVAAARAGATVVALDASECAVAHLDAMARSEGLAIDARCVDLADWSTTDTYDAVVAIGLFMFFDCATARTLFSRALGAVRPGGVFVANVLVEGTTFMAMFEPGRYCLFRRDELNEALAGWTIESRRIEDFPAPGDTVKRFSTVVARRPAKALDRV